MHSLAHLCLGHLGTIYLPQSAPCPHDPQVRRRAACGNPEQPLTRRQKRPLRSKINSHPPTAPAVKPRTTKRCATT
jgi:hypothetical protein